MAARFIQVQIIRQVCGWWRRSKVKLGSQPAASLGLMMVTRIRHIPVTARKIQSLEVWWQAWKSVHRSGLHGQTQTQHTCRTSQARTKGRNLSLNGAPGPMEGGLRGGSHGGSSSGPLKAISALREKLETLIAGRYRDGQGSKARVL